MKEHKILLVTGASSDVGAALISQVSTNYDKVIAHYSRSRSIVSALQQKFGEKIIPLQANFSDPVSIKNMLTTIDEKNIWPDHIVHFVAPKAYNQKFDKDVLENFDTDWDVSVKSIIQVLLASIPHMKKQKYGKIIFMLTSYVLNIPVKYQTSYVTTKYALLGLMKSLAVEYADKGITVNAVSPEMIETKFLAEIPTLIVEKNAMISPLGRNLTVHDVVPTYEFLLSDEADAISGVNIPITAGV